MPTPIKLYIEDDEALDTTLESFLSENDFDQVERAQITTEVVRSRGVYIGGGGAAPAFCLHLSGQEAQQ